jgi:hypothetical protein
MQSITGPAPLNSVYTTVRHGPPRDAVNSVGADGSGEHTIYYSSNWAGHVVPNSYYGGVSFWYATAVWTQPSVPANSSYPNWQNAPTASFWVGTGVTSLIQAGADSISASTATYKMWDEDYPDPTVYEGPAVRPGDKLFVYSYYNGDSTSTYYMENETTGKISSFVRSSPNVGFRAANFINERLGSLYLPNFGSTAFSSGAFADSNANYYPLTTNNDKYIMEDSAGHIQSSPTGVSNQGFTVTWSHS